MRVRGFLFLLALLAFARPLAAQEPTPGQLRAAERLVAVMQVERTWAPMMDHMVTEMHRTSPDTSAHAREMEAQLRETFATRFGWERVRPEYVRLYADLYTEEELRQLTAFYESPVGQKSLRIAPEVATRTMEMVQRLLADGTP